MNIPTIQQPGPMGMQMVPGVMPPQQQQVVAQQVSQQQAQQQQHQQEKLDNISKVKTLIARLRESLAVALKTAAQTLHQNSLVDVGNSKNTDPPDHRFNKKMEEFYSICDQIELHLKTSIECVSQHSSAVRYINALLPFERWSKGADPFGKKGCLQYLQLHCKKKVNLLAQNFMTLWLFRVQ